MIPWGSGPNQAGFRQGGGERLAAGPTAVAVRGDEALVLDARNERVLSVQSSGIRTVGKVAKNDESLAVAPDRRFVSYSPVDARATFYNIEGVSLGTMQVSRALRDLAGFQLEKNLRLFAQTSTQETVDLGTLSFPSELGQSLMSKREGTFAVRDGSRVAARVKDGAGELWLWKQGDEHVPSRKLSVEGAVSAVRVVGTAGDLVCVRVEQVTSTQASPTLDVKRRVDCIDSVSGVRTFSVTLPGRESYLPATELSVSAEPARLGWIHPETNGLRVVVWKLEGGQR